jgi:hypothetical protein
MSVLRSIESKLESLFEGVFGRAFRTNVQPVELARKLIKEMDDHRNVSVSRVYVPNEYTIYLSEADREQFSSYESLLKDELADYLAEHARRENYALLTPPKVELETDTDLDVGVFGIATRMAQTEGAQLQGEPDGQVEPGHTMVYKPSAAPVPQPTEAASPVDLGIERRHAELRQEGATYWLVDLDSTNGVEVRGKRVKRLKLEDGTRFTIGSTEIAFSRELA